MSGYPHGLSSDDPVPGKDYELRGNEIKPVLHITDWREKGLAKVQWCGKKYLSDPVVLAEGETKPCPVCGIELHYDRQKKEVVEGGFPKVSPTEPGGGMTLREVLEGTVGHEYPADMDILVAKVERFGRAAWKKGWADRKLHRHLVPDPDRGITAGVVAMMEKE